jgi:hypothetical protein
MIADAVNVLPDLGAFDLIFADSREASGRVSTPRLRRSDPAVRSSSTT